MRVLIDMNLSPAWRDVFEQAGFEAAHWSTVGKGDATDAEIFTWAKERDYLVFTHDLDFAMILAASRSTKPSVVQLRHPDIHPKKHGTRVIEVLEKFSEELETGALVSIEPDKERARLLPLRL